MVVVGPIAYHTTSTRSLNSVFAQHLGNDSNNPLNRGGNNRGSHRRVP